MNRKELTRGSEDIADDFRRLADNLRALRDKDAKAANLGRQRERLIAQAGQLFTQAAEYLPDARSVVEAFCGPKSSAWDARAWEAFYRNLWRLVVSLPAAMHPGSMSARPGEDNFPRIKTGADGKPLGRDGKPLTVVKVEDQTGTEWKLSGPVGTEVDDYDAEDHAARFRRMLTDDADACQVLAAELRTSSSRKEARPATAGIEPPGMEPLTPKAAAVLNLLRALPPERGMNGTEIIEALDKDNMGVDQSTITKSIMPVLKKHYGVENKRGIGYFLRRKQGPQ